MMSHMHLGIVTPVVNLNPRFDPPAWEREGGIADIAEVACAADELGYKWMGCPEHVAVPASASDARGGRYWDPVATLSFVAARTTSIALMPHVVVLGYHHPLEIVKRYGSLDSASAGRLILGVGVGSLQPEFELLGATFEGRGEVADDALRAIRASFAKRMPEYHGPHFSFSDFVVDPSGVQSHVPIWVGGRSMRSFRRAVELGDGWVPFGLGFKRLRAVLEDERAVDLLAKRRDNRENFEIVLAPEPPLDPVGDPEGAAEQVADYGSLGATGLALRFVHNSREHYLEQLEAMVRVMR